MRSVVVLPRRWAEQPGDVRTRGGEAHVAHRMDDPGRGVYAASDAADACAASVASSAWAASAACALCVVSADCAGCFAAAARTGSAAAAAAETRQLPSGHAGRPRRRRRECLGEAAHLDHRGPDAADAGGVDALAGPDAIAAAGDAAPTG
jgi:hypothetical protein